MDAKTSRTEASLSKAKQEARRQRDLLYTRILMGLGIVSLWMTVVMIINRDFVLDSQIISLFSISVILLIMGWLWQQYDKKRVEDALEAYEHALAEEAKGVRMR